MIKLSLWAVLCICVLFATPAYAAGAEHNFRMWTPLYSSFPIHRKVRGYFEVNPRLDNDLRGLNQLLVRPGLTYNFTQRLSGTLGYCWITNYSPTYVQEQRIWEQVLYRLSFKKLAIDNRFRLEQRLLQHTHACSNRFRYMLRLAYPIGETPYYLVAFDELFVNLNAIENGPDAGIDQNRIFAGIGRRLGSKIRVECGYQQQYINRTDIFDQGNHILLIGIFADI